MDRKLEQRVEALEADIRMLKGETSSSDLSQQAAIGATQAEIIRLGNAVQQLATAQKEAVKAQKENTEITVATNVQTAKLSKFEAWQVHPLFRITATWVGAALAAYLASRK